MSPVLASRLAKQMHDAYGPFLPGSAARWVREQNTARGLRTCWQCLDGYRPHTGPTGWPRSLGRGKRFCTVPCYLAWLRAHPGWLRDGGPRQRPTSAAVLAESRAAHRRLAKFVGAGR